MTNTISSWMLVNAVFASHVCLGAGIHSCMPDLTATPAPASESARQFAYQAGRRIVVLGSSTAQGGGAAGASTSWVGRLTAYLSPRGFTIVNSSIASSGTSDSIARFDRDVRPLAPDFVILATSIVNERISERNASAVATNYIRNTRQLIALVESLGAVAIVITPYPNNTFTPVVQAVLQQVSATFEAEGVTTWDFLSSTGDDYGRWLPGLSIDGTHPNDTGHRLLYESIPASFFTLATAPNRALPPLGQYGAWRAEPTSEDSSLSVTLATPASSWSVAFWLKPEPGTDSESIVSVMGLNMTLRRSGQRLELQQGDDVVPAGTLPVLDGFSHICLTYRSVTGMLAIYVNGELTGPAFHAAGQPTDVFGFAGASPGSATNGKTLAQILVYRTALKLADVRDLAGRRRHTKSLEAYMPLAQSTSRNCVNAANTTTSLSMSGPWVWVPDGPDVNVH